MLEVKLKDIVKKKVVKDVGALQFWKDTDGNKISSLRLSSYSVHSYHFIAGSNTSDWIFDRCSVADFEREYLEGSPYVECNSNWEPIKPIESIELINLKGNNYWKNEEGGLYMTMWHRVQGIMPTLIPMNIETSGPVIYPMAVDMLDEMKRLKLYKVPNMRLEEF